MANQRWGATQDRNAAHASHTAVMAANQPPPDPDRHARTAADGGDSRPDQQNRPDEHSPGEDGVVVAPRENEQDQTAGTDDVRWFPL